MAKQDHISNSKGMKNGRRECMLLLQTDPRDNISLGAVLHVNLAAHHTLYGIEYIFFVFNNPRSTCCRRCHACSSSLG